MNPLSPFAYHRRSKRRAFLLLALVCLATVGVCIMVRFLDFLFEQSEASVLYLTRFSVVYALGGTLDPGVVAQIRAHPDVARVIPERELSIGVPLQTSGGFPVFGVPQADIAFLMETCSLRLKEGRMLQARTNEIMLSEEIAAALGLRIGDQVSRSIDERYYGSIPTTMILVGTLETDPQSSAQGMRVGLVSYEYLESHQVYTPGPLTLLVVPKEGRKAAVDRFLETGIDPALVEVSTYHLLSELIAQGTLFIRLIFGVVDVLVAVVVALVVGTVHRIGLAQRMAELGLLHAVGRSRRWLVRRLTLETAVVTGAGWIAGLGISWLLFAWLKANLFAPSWDLDLGKLTPIWFAVPIPLVAIALAGWTTMRTFARLDAVAILDRGELGMGAGTHRRAAKHSSSRPLSSWIFYRRHSRRGLAVAVTMALMIVAVAFPVFLFAPIADSNKLLVSHLRYVSVVSPRVGTTVDPGVVAQIRTDPAVARVVPALAVRLRVSVPPFNKDSVPIYAVSEEDLQALVDLYGLQVEEGRFPEPRSNEIVLSRALAMNRSLQVGDRVGRPVYEDDSYISIEMVVVGILDRPERDPGAAGEWLGLASYEYLSSHELYASQPVSLLVVPAEGRKADVETWLNEHVASDQVGVGTYDAWLEDSQEMARMALLTFAGVEGAVAIVAALALAALSYIFFSQRKEEFGTLHAIGHSRRWLVRRTVGETVTLVAVAWLIGALVCMVGLVYMQASMYTPKGLTLNLFNPAPWLFTLPIPLAIVAVSAGLVMSMLRRLDPVSIIERR